MDVHARQTAIWKPRKREAGILCKHSTARLPASCPNAIVDDRRPFAAYFEAQNSHFRTTEFKPLQDKGAPSWADLQLDRKLGLKKIPRIDNPFWKTRRVGVGVVSVGSHRTR